MSGASRRAGRGALRALTLAAALGAGVVLAGCASAPKAVVGPKPVDVCYRAVVVARSAVHRAGRLVTVAHTDAPALLRTVRASERAAPPARLAHMHGHVCLVAWKGDFTARDVVAPWLLGRPPTRYAVVVVGDAGNKALATMLVGTRPARLAAQLSLTD